MHKNIVFDFENYREYLIWRLPKQGEKRGSRTKLAEKLNCQPAFISRVLQGVADFSLQQGPLISEFLGHTEKEEEYFFLLLHLGKAGSKKLETYYLKQINKIQEERKKIVERIQVRESLRAEDQILYYSSWIYSAIHILITIPTFRTLDDLANILQLPLQQVQNALDFLLASGVVQFNDGEYTPAISRIHLPKGSVMLSKHHQNWRLQAMQALERGSNNNLFFSGPISISKKDTEIIRQKILKFLEELEQIISPSKEEEMHCLNIDFFVPFIKESIF